MTIGAFAAGAVSVIEQGELMNQLVLIRRDLFAENAEGRVAVALRDVAKDLVVAAVFLDNIYDVINGARATRFGTGRGGSPGRAGRAARASRE